MKKSFGNVKNIYSSKVYGQINLHVKKYNRDIINAIANGNRLNRNAYVPDLIHMDNPRSP